MKFYFTGVRTAVFSHTCHEAGTYQTTKIMFQSPSNSNITEYHNPFLSLHSLLHALMNSQPISIIIIPANVKVIEHLLRDTQRFPT
jgi:hypothetical protein